MSIPSSRCPPGSSMASIKRSTMSGDKATKSLVTSKPILIRPELKSSSSSSSSSLSPSPFIGSSSPLSSSPPSLKSPYTIEKLLGHGSFAKVYLGKDVQNKESVAVKRLRLLLSDEQKRLKINERFVQEIEMMKQIQEHPNIIHYKLEYKTSTHHCLALEYAPLKWQIHSKQLELPLEIIRRRFVQLVSALYYLYKFHQIAHRDLKPDNLLLTNEGDVRLIDFGLAIQCRHNESLVSEHHDEKDNYMAKTLCGSPYYMAPELIVDRDKQYNPWISDMWSLGIILYQTIYGEVPYPVRSIPELISVIEHVPIKYPFECSATSLIRLLLQRSPEKRIILEDLIYHPFVDLKQWQSIPVPPPLSLTIASIKSQMSYYSEKDIPSISKFDRIAHHLPRLWHIYRQQQQQHSNTMLWVPFLDVLMDCLPSTQLLLQTQPPPLALPPPIKKKDDTVVLFTPPNHIEEDYFGTKTILSTNPAPPSSSSPTLLSSALPSPKTSLDPMLQRWIEPMQQVCKEQKHKINDPLTSKQLSNGWEELWTWAHKQAIRGAVHESQKEYDQAIQCYKDCCLVFYEMDLKQTHEEDHCSITKKWHKVDKQLQDLQNKAKNQKNNIDKK